MKNNKSANACDARDLKHCYTYKTHMFIMKMLPKHLNNNKCVNARGARAENHCQTQGIHTFTTRMSFKQKKNMHGAREAQDRETLTNIKNWENGVQ